MVMTLGKDAWGQAESLNGLKDNQMVNIRSVVMSNKYEADEKSYGRCRFKNVVATTTEGVTFFLWDDEKGISSARQYGSGLDPASWGRDE